MPGRIRAVLNGAMTRLPIVVLAPALPVTGGLNAETRDLGAYTCYRVDIAPDGTWHYFLSGGLGAENDDAIMDCIKLKHLNFS